MSEARVSSPDRETSASAALPDRRLQQLGGAAAVGAGGLTALAWFPSVTAPWLTTAVGAVGAVLLPVAAVLLAKAFVGDRARMGWAKLGGIALIVYSCSWLVTLLLPLVLSPGAGAIAVTTASDVVRLIVGLIAGAAIAARWPAEGFNRASMLIVVAADFVFQLTWLGAQTGSIEIMTAMTVLWPLSVLALGAGHALAGRKALAAAG